MPQIEKHEPGSLCWIELGTTDQNAAKQFYTSLFGWSAQDSPMGPNAFYTMFSLEGRNAAATYTLDAAQTSQGVPPNWMLYVATGSADETAAKATKAGGKVLAGPFDVFTFGRMAVIQDPTGVVFSIWQPKTHPGTQIEGVPGTLCWADLMTPDADRAKQFYSDVFGWQIAAGENDSSGYLHIKNGDKYLGGVPPAAHRNPNAPPHWLAYFLVASCDESTAKAKALGARAYVEPMTVEHVGRWSVLADPQGAVFAAFESMMHQG